MNSLIRTGVIGTSGYADFLHLPSLKSHPNAQFAAVCGRNRERAEGIAAKYEIPQIFTDYHDMIASGDLDAGYATQLVIDAAEESDRSGRWVEVESVC